MYTQLCKENDIEYALIDAPDPDSIALLSDILKHKGKVWIDHLNNAMIGKYGELETRFYIAKSEGKIISTIMDTIYSGVGIVSHVYTRPEYRRRGICTKLMQYMMDDFRNRGGYMLVLDTTFEGTAFWIYIKYGFKPLHYGSEYMTYYNDIADIERHFSYSPVRIIRPEWKHWPLHAVLLSVQEIEDIRSIAYDMYSVSNFESYLCFKPLWNDNDKQLRFLESESGAIVGCLYITQKLDYHILDIFVHPNFVSYYSILFESIGIPDKTICYVDSKSPNEKHSILMDYGFTSNGKIENITYENKEYRYTLYENGDALC